MVAHDLELHHLVSLNLGNGDPTKGLIELNESHTNFPVYKTNLRQLFGAVSEGWFIRDVYDQLGIQTCETTVWAREAFALGKCLTFFNSTGAPTTYRLFCNTGEYDCG